VGRISPEWKTGSFSGGTQHFREHMVALDAYNKAHAEAVQASAASGAAQPENGGSAQENAEASA